MVGSDLWGGSSGMALMEESTPFIVSIPVFIPVYTANLVHWREIVLSPDIPHLSFLEGPAKTAWMEVEVIMASGHGSQYRSENLVVSSAKLKYKVNGIV
mgnify:CR=1 FL=1